MYLLPSTNIGRYKPRGRTNLLIFQHPDRQIPMGLSIGKYRHRGNQIGKRIRDTEKEKDRCLMEGIYK
jgi:hypothetical protein